jgi:hypothetical protein
MHKHDSRSCTFGMKRGVQDLQSINEKSIAEIARREIGPHLTRLRNEWNCCVAGWIV